MTQNDDETILLLSTYMHRIKRDEIETEKQVVLLERIANKQNKIKVHFNIQISFFFIIEYSFKRKISL